MLGPRPQTARPRRLRRVAAAAMMVTTIVSAAAGMEAETRALARRP